jgi:hypothetical protein
MIGSAEAFADIFLVEPDAMQSQQPFDPPCPRT